MLLKYYYIIMFNTKGGSFKIFTSTIQTNLTSFWRRYNRFRRRAFIWGIQILLAHRIDVRTSNWRVWTGYYMQERSKHLHDWRRGLDDGDTTSLKKKMNTWRRRKMQFCKRRNDSSGHLMIIIQKRNIPNYPLYLKSWYYQI